jgi:hypothetical protein
MEVKQASLGAFLNQQQQPDEPKTETTESAAPATAESAPENVPAAATVAPPATEAPVLNSEPVAEAEEAIPFEMPDFTAPPPAPAADQSPAIDWREALKANREEALRELGLDPFALELNEHLKRGGKAADYLSAKAVDWTAVSDVDIVKQQLQQKFPQATKEQIELFFNKKYSQYELADDEDKQVGLMMLMSEAQELRTQKVAEQARYKLPEPVPPQAASPSQPDPAQQQQSEFFHKIINSEATKALFNSKRVAIDLGEGVKPVNFTVTNPQQLMDVLFNPEVAAKIGRTPQGEPDVAFWHEFALFASNRQQYKQVIRNSGRDEAKRQLVTEGQNAQRPATVVPPQNAQYASYGEAFASGNIRVGTLGRHR